MKTKKQLIKTVVRTIKSILATVLLLTCIEYFPTIASAEGEDAGTANETISEYGSTELAEAAEQSQEGSTITVNQPQQEEQASEPAQEQQEEGSADIQQQNTVENDECDKQELKENIKQENGKGENPDNSQEEIEETQEQDNKPASDTYPYYVYNQYYDVAGNQVGSNVIVLKKLDNTEATVDITFDTIISHLSKQYKARLLEGESEVEGKVTRNVTLTENTRSDIFVEYDEVVEEDEEPVTEPAEEEVEKVAVYTVTTNVEYTEDNASAIITISLDTEDEALFLDMNPETINENVALYDADDTYISFETVVNGTYNFDVQVVDSETTVEVNGVQESKRYDEPQTAEVDQIVTIEEKEEESVETDLNESPETYALPGSSVQRAYFYIWKPGTAEGTDYRTAWYYAGTGKVNMPRPTASGIKYYDMNNVVSYPKSMPNIVSDDKTYYYDENGTDTVHQYTYRMNWAYIRDVYGANDGDKEITKENVYHVDGYAILSDKLTIDFEVYYPDDDGFSSITGWPKLFAENAKVVAPTVSNTTVYNGITYEFDGWYTDGSLTTKATENDFIATSNKVFYGKYKQILNVHYYKNRRYEYEDYIQTVYYNEYTTTVDGSALSHDNDKTFVGWVLDYTKAGIKSAEGVIASKKAYENLLNSNLLIAPNANYGPITEETTLYAVWAKESITTPLKIKYEWNLPTGITYYNDLGSTLDPQPVVPADNNTYYSGYSYMVDSTYTYGDKVYTVDSYGNINGVYTFSGWTDPNNGIMGDANVTIKGTWTYTPMDVTKYTVTYTYEGDTPTNAPAVPEDEHKYVNNEPFTASTAKVADIPTYDTYRNQNGVWKFNRWTPVSGKIEGANVTIKGSWSYETVQVATHSITIKFVDDYGNALKDQLSYTLINNQDYDYSSLAEGKLIKDGNNYVLENISDNIKGTISKDEVIIITYSIDIKGNEENGCSDEIPDKYQIMFTYESAGNGTVDGKEKVFETHTFRDENEELIPAGKAKPSKVPSVDANTGYAFDYWTHGEEKDFNSNMSKFVVDYEADQTFKAYFDKDEVGEVDPEGEDKPDGTPDKYQVRVDYVAVNGTVDFDHVYVTLYDEDHVYSETGTGNLTEEQIPGTKANAGFENGKWDVEPTTEIVIKENTVFTITFTAIPAPEVVPPNPGRTCQDDGYPEGYTWDEGQQACVCTADVCRVPEHPQPGNGGEQLPEETDEPVVVEEEITPTTPAPEVEEIVEEETPLVAGRSWALVNLIACITGAVLAIVLLIMKKSKSEELEDEYDENGMKIEKTDEEKEDEAIPYIRKTMWKVVTAIVAIVAVIVFFLTEDMRLPMVMVDKWTLLMIIFALVNVLSLVLGMKWHEDEKVVNIVGNSATVAYNGSMQDVRGYTTDINTKKIEVTLKKDAKDEVSGVNVGRYNMGLTADCFEVKSDVYSNIKLVVTDGYLDIKAKD